jgi:ribonuclease VapC
MIIDASAVIAIAFEEDDAARFSRAILRSDRRLIAMPTLLEVTLVVGARSGAPARSLLGRLLSDLDLTAVPFGADHLAAAQAAWWRFGKGRHPAGLNLGDCFSYALAKVENQPLLFKGRDFDRTDIPAAPY